MSFKQLAVWPLHDSDGNAVAVLKEMPAGMKSLVIYQHGKEIHFFGANLKQLVKVAKEAENYF